MKTHKTLINKLYKTITKMSNPIEEETPTTTTEAQNSSINPNPEENGRPIYSTENPLMQPPPTQIQSSMSSENNINNSPTTTVTATEEQQPPQRSNPQENTPEAITATSTNPEIAQQQQLQQLQAVQQQQQQKQKVELNTIDATLQGLYIQIIAHQHNKINILSGATNAPQL